MSGQRRYTVAVDFDGVLHQYSGDWKGHHVIEGEPMPGAIEWLFDMLQHFHVVILTTRGRTWRGRRAVRAWVRQHAGMWWYPTPTTVVPLEEIRVTDRKPPALVYIDDRAVRFTGNFPGETEIHRALPWWKEPS